MLGINNSVPLWGLLGPRQVGVTHGLMKGQILGIQAILGLEPACDSGLAQRRFQIQDDDQIRPPLALHKLLKPLDTLRAQTPSHPLIGIRGIGEAIANNRVTSGQSRFDELG